MKQSFEFQWVSHQCIATWSFQDKLIGLHGRVRSRHDLSSSGLDAFCQGDSAAILQEKSHNAEEQAPAFQRGRACRDRPRNQKQWPVSGWSRLLVVGHRYSPEKLAPTVLCTISTLFIADMRLGAMYICMITVCFFTFTNYSQIRYYAMHGIFKSCSE